MGMPNDETLSARLTLSPRKCLPPSLPVCLPCQSLANTAIRLPAGYDIGSAKDIDIAVASSRKAFRTVWGRNVSPVERGKLLNRLADLMERDSDALADLEALDNGKSAEIAKEVDLPDSIACLRCVTIFFTAICISWRIDVRIIQLLCGLGG